MPMCNRRELLIRAGLARPPMISVEQKAEFVAQCTTWNPEAFDEMPQNREPGFARSVWALLGWAGVGTVAWIVLAGAAMAWLS